MTFALIGAAIGLVLAFSAARSRERQVRDAGYDGVSMREREQINRAQAVGAGPPGTRPSGSAEYGCVMVLLPTLGFVLGLVVSAIVG